MRLPAANASAIGLLRVLLAASLIVPVALFAGVTWLDYRAAIEDSDHDLERTIEVASENAEKVFDSQTQLADRVNDLITGLNANAIQSDEKLWHETLNGMGARLPHVSSILIAANSGQPLASAAVFPVPRDVDLRNRDYFKAIINDHRALYISDLQVGDVYTKLFFGLSRPWTGSDGTLKGVIDVAVSSSFFEDFYQTVVDEGSGSASGKVVTLIRNDGHILVRYPPFPKPPTIAATPPAFLHAIEASPDSGILHQPQHRRSDNAEASVRLSQGPWLSALCCGRPLLERDPGAMVAGHRGPSAVRCSRHPRFVHCHLDGAGADQARRASAELEQIWKSSAARQPRMRCCAHSAWKQSAR